MAALTDLDAETLSDLVSRDEFFWLDLDDPDAESLDAVGESLGLHELAIEDSRDFGQRPKADTYRDEMLLVYYGARLDDCGAPAPVEVHLHISPRFVVTVHREQCRKFDAVREVLSQGEPADADTVIYRVIDALTDSLLDVLETVDDEIEAYEEEVLRRPRARDRDRLAVLRRSLGSLRRLLTTQRPVFERSMEQLVGLSGLGHDASVYFRDIADHLARALDQVEAARDAIQSMLDSYSNEVQERLTIVATIFLPLTLVASFFGQNFQWMVDHIGSAWAFWGLGVGGLLVAGIAIIGWLIRSGLYAGPRR